MKVTFSIDVDDRVRRALRAYRGKRGLASREEVRHFYISHGGAVLDDVMWEFERGERSDEEEESDKKAEGGGSSDTVSPPSQHL